MLSSLTVSYDDPEYLAGVVFERLVYGPHPYGRPDSGTPASLAAITRDDLVAFHQTWFGANNAILAIVGDVTTTRRSPAPSARSAAGARPRVRRRRSRSRRRRPGGWSSSIGPAPCRPRSASATPRCRASIPTTSRSISPSRSSAAKGGNRLHRVLRSDRGLTYGASADLNALKDAGTIVADTDTRSETTGEALRLIVDEMWKLQRERVGERELSDAQAYLTGSFPLTIETPSAIAAQVLSAVFFGLDLAGAPDLPGARQRRHGRRHPAGRAHLSASRTGCRSCWSATRPSSRSSWPAPGSTQFERIPVSELDLSCAGAAAALGDRCGRTGAADWPELPGAVAKARARRGAAARTDDAEALIERAVRGKGGLARLKTIRTVHAVSDTVVEAQGKKLTVPTTIRMRYPGAFRIDSEMPAGPV